MGDDATALPLLLLVAATDGWLRADEEDDTAAGGRWLLRKADLSSPLPAVARTLPRPTWPEPDPATSVSTPATSPSRDFRGVLLRLA